MKAPEVEVTLLIGAMVRALQPDFVVETGTCVGSTAAEIGMALQRNGHGHLVSLEVNADHVAIARQRCAGLPVSILHQSSVAWGPDRPIDFAFFDSFLRLRPLEFERYLPWMHERTIVAFHDTGPQHPVRTLLAPLERKGLLLSPLYLPTPRGVMFARVGREQQRRASFPASFMRWLRR